MRYRTIIRRFLGMSDCPISNIDNKSLELTRPKARKKRKKIISPDIWKSLHDSIARVIMGLQIEFGLTFKEAILIKPHIHVSERSLWITREIAFNSSDRTIPVRTENQTVVLNIFNWLTQQNGNLLRWNLKDRQSTFPTQQLQCGYYFGAADILLCSDHMYR
jgi:hypothetical protein